MKVSFPRALPVLAALFCLDFPVWAAPSFSSSGTITSGPAMAGFTASSGTMSITTPVDDAFNSFIVMNPNGMADWLTSGVLKDKKVSIDPATSTTTFSGKLDVPALKTPIPVTWSMTLTPAGTARCTVNFETDGDLNALVPHCQVSIRIDRTKLVGSGVAVDDDSYAVPANTRGNYKQELAPLGRAKKIVFWPEDAKRRTAFHIVQAAEPVRVTDYRAYGNEGNTVQVTLLPVNNKIVYEIALPETADAASADTYGGIDYYAANKAHLPRYGASRNLVQNPGFENGFQYWQGGSISNGRQDLLAADPFFIQDAGAFDGRRCLKLIGTKGIYQNGLATLAIPVKLNGTYTFSFYARSDIAGSKLAAVISPSKFGHSPAGLTPGDSTTLGTEWKRYVYSFTSNSSALSVSFSPQNPDRDTVLYVDNVQLEEGTAVTDFTQKPYTLDFATAHRDNTSQPGERMNARWNIRGRAGARGTLVITLTDFLAQVKHRETVPVALDANGFQALPQPWAEGLGAGMYVEQADLKMDDGFTYTEYGRLGVIQNADPTVKHHLLLSMGEFNTGMFSWERTLANFQRYGIGGAVRFDPQPAALTQLLLQHDITQVSPILMDSEAVGYTGQGRPITWPTSLWKRWYGTDADLPGVEQFAYERVQANPGIRFWKTINEPNATYLNDPALMKDLMKPLAAIYRGAKRANPNAVVFSPDPANIAMQSNGGGKWLEAFIDAGGLKVCDAIAIHTYRPRPEDPDLDADTKALLAMLDKHGYTGPVYWTEGGGHVPLHLPPFGINIHSSLSTEGGDNWRLGVMSYDMGWGERMAAAYAMRYWLVGLKYSKRIQQQAEWYFGAPYIDYDCIPEAKPFACNTLSRLLGNADFVRDVPMGRDIRAYVFQDEKQRPVVAIWSKDLAHEDNFGGWPALKLGAGARDLEGFNMDGSQLAIPTNGDLPIGPFPIFLRAKAGSTEATANALENAGAVSFTGGAVSAWAQVQSASKASVSLRNSLTRPLQGTVAVTLAGKPVLNTPLEIEPGGVQNVSFDWPGGNAQTASADGSVTWTTAGPNPQVSTFPIHLESYGCPRVTTPPNLDGDLSDWPAAGVIPLPSRFMEFGVPASREAEFPNGVPWTGAADLSGTLYMAYDEANLYLAVKVRDDAFAPSAAPEGAWTGDGLQLYFDPWAKGHAGDPPRYLPEDQTFQVWPNPNGTVVTRDVAPDVQLAFLRAGAVNEVTSRFNKTADGYTVAMAFPIRQLAPLSLTPGSVFNFALIVNDSDGPFRKRGLTLTPAGTQPFNRPDLYPTIILRP